MTESVKPPTRAQVGIILKRYLKPEAIITPRADFPVFYTLFKSYPSLDFWMRHELLFKLNNIRWFLTPNGKAQLASDWTTFNFVLDNETQPDYDGSMQDSTPNYIQPPKTIKTVADLLS